MSFFLRWSPGALVVALALLLTMPTLADAKPLMYSERMGLAFNGPGSVWTTPLAAHAPIDRESANLVAIMDQWFPGRIGDRANFTIDSGAYLYIAEPSDPLVTVTLEPGADYQEGLQQVFNAVPWPPEAQPSPDSDHRMAILDPATGCIWEFWQLYPPSGGSGWTATWGGRTCNVWTDPGVYRNVQDAAGNVLEQSGWGNSAAGLDEMGGVMMVDQLSHGSIPHAIALAIDSSANCSGVWNEPGQRTDGLAIPLLDANGEPTNCIPEGARFRLPPPCPSGTPSTPGVCFNLADLNGDPPIVTEMAAAAQRYGLIDANSTNGGGVAVESGDAQSAPYQVFGSNPYTTAIPGEPNTPFLGGYDNIPALDMFPWTWLELMQMSVTSTPDTTLYTEPDPPAPVWPAH